MIGFYDTDIILKLAAFNLFEEALDVIGVASKRDVYVPVETADKILRDKRRRAKFSQAALTRAVDFVSKAKRIESAGDPEETRALRVDGIDPGEADLFKATKGVDDFLLVTSDKNALRTLTNLFLAQELHNRHLGRVVCLEQILLRILNRNVLSFSVLCQRLRSECQCDRAVANALRDGTATEEEFKSALRGYVQRLRYETQGLLVAEE